MNPGGLVWVALGGALGAVMRVSAGWIVPNGRLAWGTLVVNVLGSLIIGALIGKLGPVTPENMRWHLFLVGGFCGGFTTFSTFSWQTLELLQRGQWGWAAVNVLLSVSACLLATWTGWRCAQ